MWCKSGKTPSTSMQHFFVQLLGFTVQCEGKSISRVRVKGEIRNKDIVFILSEVLLYARLGKRCQLEKCLMLSVANRERQLLGNALMWFPSFVVTLGYFGLNIVKLHAFLCDLSKYCTAQ